MMSKRLPAQWDQLPDLLSVAETAALLRQGLSVTYEQIRSGPLRDLAIHWGARRILIPKAALRRLIESEDQ
jgi:hypothetical protein